MYQIIRRDLTAVEDFINPLIRFFAKTYVKHSIDNVLVNRFFLSTIHNFIEERDARYRYLEQIPHILAALIYYVTLFCFSSIIAIFKVEGQDSCKNLCTTFGIQVTFSLVSLCLSIIGSLSPPHAMNITLFYGEKIIELFDNEKEETEKICEFVKNFWSSYRIRIQEWMLMNQKLRPENKLNYQMRVIDIHRKLKTLSDVRNLFRVAIGITHLS